MAIIMIKNVNEEVPVILDLLPRLVHNLNDVIN